MNQVILKTRLKIAISKLAAPLIPFQGCRTIILCYHSVHPNKSFASASPELFQRHLEWLTGHCEPIRFSQALQTIQGGNGSKPRVAITFDDGYGDNYEFAFPLLQSYQIPATFFVTVGLLEKDQYVVRRVRALRGGASEADVHPLTWEQVREMRKAGMEFGSHTWSHLNLARLQPDEIRKELGRSKSVMEERLGEEVTLLAYPFGKPRHHFTRITMEIAAELGYRTGAAVLFRRVKHSDHPLALPRFFVTKDDVQTLAAKVMGAWDWLGWWQEHAPLWAGRVVSRKDFEV